MAWLTKPHVSPGVTAALLPELKQLLSKFKAMDISKNHHSPIPWEQGDVGELASRREEGVHLAFEDL